MSQRINYFKADLRDFRFLLFEQFDLQKLLGKPPFEDWGRDDVEMVLDEVYKWVCEEIGPLNGLGDAQGCRLEDGKVSTPEGFKQAWKSLYEAGWRGLAAPSEYGGQGGPYTVHSVAEELMAGANAAFTMYPGLTQGAAEVLAEFGTDEQKQVYCEKLYGGAWGGTMCLTEPHAGSDVGASTTKAAPITEGEHAGKYKIQGTKIYISGGDQDLSENIMHLVLARTPGAAPGTRGLSLFIVMRDRADGSGNDVSVSSIEHKMGIKASSTCVLNFGDNGDCVGELVGAEEQVGIKQMFRMMNAARIGVGTFGVGVASTAYLNALEFARDRKQGASIKQWKNPEAPRVPIIEHADVRRMLLDMKARVEGIRALVIKLCMHTDKAHAATLADDANAASYHQGQVDLLVPLVKAYGSDQAFQICTTAIQVLGGAGYLRDHPVEQYCRDSKIFSIYEGTNHIQALDLVGRKLGQKGGVNYQAFLKDLNAFVAANKEHPAFAAEIATLGKAGEALTGVAMRFWGWFTNRQAELVPLAANRFLDMMAEATVGWLLLEGAVIAHAAAEKLGEGHADRAFYEGRQHAARYFARTVLPDVIHRAGTTGDDRSPLEIPAEAFATI